ncbi:MAG: metal-sulfur cluster assembly factor [Acidothermus sp.]|nr:metal-sulfur cluster assembly factor [Acidothermus sp.]MCL6538551.1 metal-sulfur cluster assembly factor [Acidothermus sp.]
MDVTALLEGPPDESKVRELLRDVIDPEVGINIVDLGLLRGIEVQSDGTVRVATTLTTPACPLGPYISEQIYGTIAQLPGVRDIDVEIVWSPPWDPDRDMSDEAKRLLGWRR